MMLFVTPIPAPSSPSFSLLYTPLFPFIYSLSSYLLPLPLSTPSPLVSSLFPPFLHPPLISPYCSPPSSPYNTSSSHLSSVLLPYSISTPPPLLYLLHPPPLPNIQKWKKAWKGKTKFSDRKFWIITDARTLPNLDLWGGKNLRTK